MGWAHTHSQILFLNKRNKSWRFHWYTFWYSFQNSNSPLLIETRDTVAFVKWPMLPVQITQRLHSQMSITSDKKEKKRFEKIKRKRKLWIPSPPFLALYKSCYTGCGLSLLLLPLLLLLWLVTEVQEWATGRRATPVRLKWPNGNVHTHTRSPPCSLFLYSVVCCVCMCSFCGL